MDRMEMCRGSAILKSDIEREVETALREMMDASNPAPGGVVWVDEPNGLHHHPETGAVFLEDDGGDSNQVKPTPASIADKTLKALADAHMPKCLSNLEAYPGWRWSVDDDGNLVHEPIAVEDFYETGSEQEALDVTGIGKGLAKPACAITLEEAEKRGIPLGSAGYVWVG